MYPLDELSAATGLTVVPVLASREEIAKRIKSHLGVGSETIDGLLAATDDRIELDQPIDDDAELSEMAQEPSVVRLVNEILLEAIELRASDVHIESQHSGLRVRYRIDGVLHLQPMPPEIHRFQAAIISRLKIMSRLNIAERRLPQDGRIQLRTGGREVDIRVSVIPMIHGEGIVLRLLDKGAMEFKLGKLGMEPDLYAKFRELIQLPHGIILVTGPTGSGKSTTLYSCALGNQERRDQDHHHRGPGGVPVGRHQPDPGTPQDRPDVRQFAAEHLAPRPGHHPRGRNPRPGDGRERHPGLADGPPRFQHAAHQRRGGGLHAVGRHGPGAVPGLQHGGSRHGPATGPHALQALQAAVPTGRR